MHRTAYISAYNCCLVHTLSKDWIHMTRSSKITPRKPLSLICCIWSHSYALTRSIRGLILRSQWTSRKLNEYLALKFKSIKTLGLSFHMKCLNYRGLNTAKSLALYRQIKNLSETNKFSIRFNVFLITSIYQKCIEFKLISRCCCVMGKGLC